MGRIGFQPVMPGPVWDDNTVTNEVVAADTDLDITVPSGVYYIVFQVHTTERYIYIRDDVATDKIGIIGYNDTTTGPNNIGLAVKPGSTIRVARDADTAWNYTTFKHTD